MIGPILHELSTQLQLRCPQGASMVCPPLKKGHL